ncbi:MFS general substrate transporter [Rhizodiscina lignyota]|uniref:MFS general substrate transporter n=1 Tax=Rhizodiscina lignyota TaxID=1504668 RepID=A0A9P4IE92_9PEZI|nr:MFS general substrate transporter [Rhizodiscina lignyota]
MPQDVADNSLTRVPSGPPYSVWSPRAKIFIIMSVATSALISPFGATTYWPAMNLMSNELHISPTLVNLSITTYMIAQGISPALIATMSDNSGRRLSFIICFIIYMIANIGLALQTNYAALLILRLIQAFGCSAAIALSIAVVSDIATSSERGKYTGYSQAGIVMGTAFGPTVGGLLAQYLGWRSIFWFLAIFSGVMCIIFTIFFPETCRNVVGNGSIPATGLNQSLLGYWQQRRQRKERGETTSNATHENKPRQKRKIPIPNPLRTLYILGEKESAIVLLYNGFFFCGMMIVTGSLPYMYEQAYNLGTLQIGLCYIAMGSGSVTAALSMGHVVDWNFRRHAKRVGLVIIKGKQQDLSNFPIEVVRCQIVLPGHIMATAALIAFGWCMKFRTHIAIPEVLLYFIGFGISTTFNTTNALLVDLHRDKPATATAAVNFVRCMISAGGVSVIIPMIQAMNPGWTFTFVGLIYVFWTSMLFLIMKRGQQWRNEKAQKEAEARAAREAADIEKYSVAGSDHNDTKEADMKASSVSGSDRSDTKDIDMEEKGEKP